MKLIPEWRTSWRFWSMQVAAAVAAAADTGPSEAEIDALFGWTG